MKTRRLVEKLTPIFIKIGRVAFLLGAFLLLTACATDDFTGSEEAARQANGDKAISFGSATPAVTRADKGGADAAGDLNRNFVLFGYKTMSGPSKQTVFDNYQVNYVNNTGGSTTSNSAGWEYVGYKNLPNDMTSYTGVSGNTTSGIDQTIKYWDYSASNYKFYAYSLGSGKAGTYANASKMTTSDTYTLEGDADQLAACYISELKTIDDPGSSTATEVDLRFLSIKSKIQLGFYETIPGYSVKSLQFYDSSTDDTSDGSPVLYAGLSTLPKAGTYTITFDAAGKPVLAWAAAASDGTQSNVSFSSTFTNYASKEYLEEDLSNTYIGRSSNAATKTEVKDVLPYATGAYLTLKVDYTLVSRDGTGETIEVKGATAKVPAAFTQWKPNYKYTYIFKISDNTNGAVGEVIGLKPITLDAVIASEQDGSQETITTVSEPSITTYANASAVLTDNEYKTGANIYVVVDKNGTVQDLTSSNAKLYTAKIEDGAAQEITEQSVANAIVTNNDGYDIGEILSAGTDLTGYYTYNGSAYQACVSETADGTTTYYKPATYSVKDANGKKLVVNAKDGLVNLPSIPAADSPTGVAISVNCAKFTPTTAGYYVFEFIDTADGDKKYYKIIKVAVP